MDDDGRQNNDDSITESIDKERKIREVTSLEETKGYKS